MSLISEWIDRLGLSPHPEGGYYYERYRSRDVIPTDRGERSVCTAIYFLLEAGQFSALHRIKSDEIWHFYAGSSLLVSGILPDGSIKGWQIGLDIAAGEEPQCVVPAGTWFGAEVVDPTGWSLVGCTVAPGFDFADFELADRADLVRQFPQHEDLIIKLTH